MRETYAIIDGEHYAARVDPSEKHVTVDVRCPHCRAEAPIKLAGSTGAQPDGPDCYYYESDGVALCCRTEIGKLRAYADTIFGQEEDERVLFGRARVYWGDR